MIRAAVFAALLAACAAPAAAEEEVLRLACQTTEGGQQAFAFSIDFAAKDAVETLSGKRLTVSSTLRDHIVLSDGGTAVFRIARVPGTLVVDRQLRLEGRCEKVERKF
ncbi:MAG: hypothetical protein AB1918_10915 [Pseudomonadota bacterium]